MPRTLTVETVPEIQGASRHHTVFGMYIPEQQLIQISLRQTPREMLDTIVHEMLHFLDPSMSEWCVRRRADWISTALWKAGYRRREGGGHGNATRRR